MWPIHCVQNTKGSEFNKDLNVKESDIIISKGTDETVDSYSGFGNLPEMTILDEKLKELDVKTVYCVGLAYDYCVGATAIDASKSGYKTYLIKDATRSVNEESHKLMNKRLIESEVIQIESSEL